MTNLPGHAADIFASLVNASYEEKLQILDAVDLVDKLKLTLPLLIRHTQGNFDKYIFLRFLFHCKIRTRIYLHSQQFLNASIVPIISLPVFSSTTVDITSGFEEDLDSTFITATAQHKSPVVE